jgi:hypothetical protein
MRNSRTVVLILTLLSYACALPAQNIYFEKTFGTPNSDLARSVKQLPDGTIYVAGFSNSGPFGGFDVTLSRLDRYGNLQWTKYYGDSYDNTCLFMNLCSDGNIVLTGEDQGTPTGIDAFAYKLDTAGNVVWHRVYATSVNESTKYIEQTSDGGFIMCGFQSDAYGSNDVYVIKADAAGNMEWDQVYGGMDNDYSDMIRELPGGGYLLTADTKSMGAGGYDVYVLKLDASGNSIWDFTYGDQWQNGCQGIFITSAGKYLSYGETEIYQFSQFDFYLELIDTNGATIWKRTFGGTEADAAFSVVETPDGGFMLTGYSNSYNSIPGPLELVVFKTDAAGNFQWARPYGSEGIDLGYEIIHSLDNGYLITGKTFINNSDDYYLLHLDQLGTNSLQEGIEHDDMLLYPNPAQNRFTVSRSLAGESAILKIFSIDGKLALQKELSLSSAVTDIGHLIPGTYIVEVGSSTKICRQKLLIVP